MPQAGSNHAKKAAIHIGLSKEHEAERKYMKVLCTYTATTTPKSTMRTKRITHEGILHVHSNKHTASQRCKQREIHIKVPCASTATMTSHPRDLSARTLQYKARCERMCAHAKVRGRLYTTTLREILGQSAMH